MITVGVASVNGTDGSSTVPERTISCSAPSCAASPRPSILSQSPAPQPAARSPSPSPPAAARKKTRIKKPEHPVAHFLSETRWANVRDALRLRRLSEIRDIRSSQLSHDRSRANQPIISFAFSKKRPSIPGSTSLKHARISVMRRESSSRMATKDSILRHPITSTVA